MADPADRPGPWPDLFGELDAAGFRDGYWQKNLIAWSVPPQARLAFDLDDLVAILRHPAAGPEFVQVVAGQRRQGAPAVRQMIESVGADAGRLEQRLQAGDSVIVRRVDRFRDDIEQLRRALIRALGCPVSVNLFAAMAGKPTIGWHTDPSATLALQLQGQKDWQVARPDGAVSDHALVAGAALYFPAGWRHCARGARGLSLSLSFALTPWTADAVLAVYLDARRAAADAPALPALPTDLLDDPARARAALQVLLADAIERHLAEFDDHVEGVLEQVIASTFDSYRG